MIDHPTPAAPAPRTAFDGRTAAAAAIGVAATLILVPVSHVQPAAAATAAAVTVLAGALLSRRRRRVEAPAAADAADAVAPPFAAALEALPDPFLIVEGGARDDRGARRIAFANLPARELMRVPREGSPLFSAVRRPEILEAVEISLYEGRPHAVAYEAPGAQERFWRVATTPLGSGPNDRRYAVLFLRDDTDARRAERTRVDFLANASHELRTPLASLSGFIETLRGHAREDPAARDRFLAIMAAQTERMSRLTDDLLSLSRVELNEHVPPSGRCDLSLAVTDVADALAPLIAERRVELRVTVPPRGEAAIVGERDQIVQVVQNLLANAVKYSPTAGRIEIEVAVAAAPEEAAVGSRAAGAVGRVALLTPDRAAGSYAVLRVSDHGPGMQREHLPRLTERFYRVEGQKSGERAGTGLGLAIVKHIINRHRGGLVVESAPDLGSRFIAYFPRDPAAVTSAATTAL